jgi:hypothetical protein
MSDTLRKTKEAIKQAKSKGFTVVHGNSQTLLIDLDLSKDPSCEKTFRENFSLLQDFIQAELGLEWRSQHGNLHRTVRLGRPFSLVERLLLQACLGSDLKKELLGLIKTYEGEDSHNLLFKPKHRS